MAGRSWRRELTLAAAILVVCAALTLAAPAFATPSNLATVFRNSTELLLIGLGLTMLLAMGSIDVSVGVALGLVAIVIGRLLQADAPLWLVVIAGPLAGALLGTLTASVVVLGRIPPIVGTLGLYGVFRTLIFVALGGRWLSGLSDDLTSLINARLAGIPLSYWIVLLAYLAVWVALRRTPFGTHVLAIGHSPDKARLAGVAVTRVRFAVFVTSGVLVGIAAVVYVATYRNVEMTTGSLLALEGIAAVVLGGTHIMGGRCSLLGTLLGVALLRVLQNGLVLIGLSSLWQPVVVGALLVAVLVLDSGTAWFDRARPARSGA